MLSGCSSKDPAGQPLAGQDIAPAARSLVADGGTLRWAVDTVPDTLNTFQADADATTARVAQAVLPSLYRLDESGRPEINPDYLESAKVVETEPKQVVLYKLNQQAVWSDGREIGAADFAAQWRALSGKDSAYWTARNAGYERIQRIERGANDLEVKVTFARPYADWRSLFSPLYPKGVMGTPDSFNDSARRKLKVTAGPFAVRKIDRKDDEITLARNPRWWGSPPRLDEIVLRAVPRDERAQALAAGTLDLAEIDTETVRRIGLPPARHGAKGTSGPSADGTPQAGPEGRKAAERPRAMTKYDRRQQALKRFEVRRSLEPAFTQLALNGAEGPLADERVRRAVARALDREELARVVLKPLGLPAEPVGSHLALAGQAAYADNSGALGDQDTAEAQALLADAGWVPGGPVKQKKGEKAAGAEKEKKKGDKDESSGKDEGTYVVGDDDKAPAEADREKKRHGLKQQGGAQGAYAPKGTAAPKDGAAGALAKDGKPLTLRFVLPSGPGSETLRMVAERIRRMLDRVGIRTELSKVSDESYFKDHIASGEYDLALYSWPASAFPATDARPIYAKPVPAADGSLNVEQNYTRVGTDQVDQLFEQAVSTLNESESRGLIRKADSRIWAAAGSIPLYQRPQLTAARKTLANTGAFGFRTPVYEDMGFLKKGARPAAGPAEK
ncbi:ABC transporter family substrate-binding protein [Streptomyces cinnabarinus]|uniref:ABC transporter family substrate-binding protein n=1 Tax=Streptomyces cinnabarinus TaxID=67287 RepID=A0ABY7KS57_9ACTN|nr:ABC transporter family substrate-binding protein [Streptomyces cinnabarinus]WAZ27189.1 ABC transporter family substrate-binding protein [Streptomyces cinnabarinus]